MFKTLASLALIGAACGLALFGLNDITRSDIEKNRTKKAREIMTELLKQPLPDDIVWVEGVSGNCQLGYFVMHAENGYSGPINFFALYQPNLSTQNPLEQKTTTTEQLSLRVTRHQETPGIGDFIDHKRERYLPDLDQQSIAQWQNLDNITGATITHRAIKKAALNIQTRVRYHNEKFPCVE